jgi:hypothetical protein
MRKTRRGYLTEERGGGGLGSGGPRSRRQGREGGAAPRRDLGQVNRRARGVLLDPFARFLPPAPSDLGLGGAARPGRQRRVLVLLDRRALLGQLDCAATC